MSNLDGYAKILVLLGKEESLHLPFPEHHCRILIAQHLAHVDHDMGLGCCHKGELCFSPSVPVHVRIQISKALEDCNLAARCRMLVFLRYLLLHAHAE